MEHLIYCPACGGPVLGYNNPFPTADLVAIQERQVLLILRKNPPSGWALPGGFIDYGESAEDAAVRELQEETGLYAANLRLVGVYSRFGRDPRFHTLTVAYRAEVSGALNAGDDASDARWFPLDGLPDNIAFDHRDIIRDACLLNG
ncbi:MAG: NUDIX hydrolase [bacterium]|nr:NUDIX hydrolase [bacterium]